MDIAVIIATKDRHEAIKKISLPSLVKQDKQNFIVIVWDASENDLTKEVCTSFEHKLILIYKKAPRVGLASQRNDSIKYLLDSYKDIKYIVFIDDDSEMSSDAISGLILTYETEPNIFGINIPLKLAKQEYELVKQLQARPLHKIFRKTFLKFSFPQRHVTKYCWNDIGYPETNGQKVNWLSGCSMSFRVEVFTKIKLKFNESLQKFGGYSYGEDVEFSFKLANMGYQLINSKKGFIIHHNFGTARLNIERYVSSLIYNKFIVFKEAVFKTNKMDAIYFVPFVWYLIGELITIYRIASNEQETKNFYKGILNTLK